jgi:hypothetical protein
VADAPERLLLVFLCFCYVSAAAYVTWTFRPLVVVPVTVVVAALTWRLFPGDGPRDARAAAGSVVAFLLAGAWFLGNLPYVAERVQVSRDPDLYTLAALWMLDHVSPSIPVNAVSAASPGFGLVNGSLQPQGNHLVAAVSASAGWVFGESAVFWGNLACGAAALLALYVFARRLVGPFWALAPMAALAASMPMLEFSRALYSEPLALLFTILGANLLWSAWQRDSAAGYAFAGAAFGAVAFARIDGTLPLLGVLVGLTVAAFVHPGRDASRRRWAAPLVLLGALPGVLLGLADLYFHSWVYMLALAPQLKNLLAGFVVAALITVTGALFRVPARRLAGTARVLSWAATTGAVLAAAAFLVLLSRPWWYVSHGDFDNVVVANIQKAEGAPVDGTRLYYEDSFQWLSWYYGWPVVLIGLAGLLAWVVVGARSRRTELLWLSALFLPSALLYLAAPHITPDQIWAMRRFLPVVIPGVLLATVWVARALAGRNRVIGVVMAVLVAVGVAGWPLTTVNDLWTVKNKGGALAGTQQVCDRIDGRPTVVTGFSLYLPTVLALCDVPAVHVKEPTPTALADARTALGGEDVVLLTRGPGGAPWVDGKVAEPIQFAQVVWEHSLEGPPDETVTQTVIVTLGLVAEDGRVTPLP